MPLLVSRLLLSSPVSLLLLISPLVQKLQLILLLSGAAATAVPVPRAAAAVAGSSAWLRLMSRGSG